MDVPNNLTSLVQFGAYCTQLIANTNSFICKGKWWPNLELNQGHADFQSAALPTELFGLYFEMTIDEPKRARFEGSVFNRLAGSESSFLSIFQALFV